MTSSRAMVDPGGVTDHDSLTITRVANGDLEAFAILYARHRDEILHYARKRTSRHDLAEDVTSEVFLRALERLETFHDGNFAAWLTRIASNVLASHFRSAPARLEVPLEGWEAIDHAPGPDLVLIIEAEERGRMESLESAWHHSRRLNDDHRTCLTLRFLEGKTIAQTAELMDRSVGAVKLLQHRATRVLREQLSGRTTTSRARTTRSRGRTTARTTIERTAP
jgi:RNA polymerase sigma-70 factor (ECF subfamily)